MAEWMNYQAAMCALSLAVGTVIGFCVGVEILVA